MIHLKKHSPKISIYCQPSLRYFSWVILFIVQFSLAQNNVLCNNESTWFGVDLNENDGNGTNNSTYEWYVSEEAFEGEIIPQTNSGNQIIIDWLSTPTGVYTITVEEFSSEALCNPNPETIKVQYINAQHNPITGNNVVCEGDIVQLNHPESENGEWQIEDENIADVLPDGTVYTYQDGETDIHLNYSIQSCQFTATTELEVLSRPNPNINDDIFCLDEGESILLDSGLSNNNYTYHWSHNNENLNHSEPQLNVSEPGTYEFYATNSATGCNSAVITLEVITIIEPEVSTTVETDFNANQTITVHIENPSNYTFRLGNSNPQESNVFNNVSIEGLHTIYIEEINGCYSLTIDVNIINYPRFFTPNNDGYNDTWNISSLSYDTNAKIFIHDRFGKLLKMISPSSTGWDGTYRGRQMPSNDYWFSVHYRDRKTETKQVFKSNFTLKR
ncbi:MAG: T9SS type B sorting domain-containing protein [Bacteroidota bacterium]